MQGRRERLKGIRTCFFASLASHSKHPIEYANGEGVPQD
jgi:hypothetical protein